jgi:hypothetical protein
LTFFGQRGHTATFEGYPYGMRFLFFLVVTVTVALIAGCTDETSVCCGSCPAPQPAIFNLTCGSAGLSNVSIAGPCAGLDAGGGGSPSYVGDNRVIL